ncbi:aldo/keto reductase [Eubacteriales bacterium OttesenSCG-928-N14]|nr:aldo/keto reductase [Eubacteriales bacterium OttesenSCG-928-N14]
MEYTYLGRTGLKVSRLVLGTMNFATYTDEAESHRIMDAALDAGINFFDTSNGYGGDGNKGGTERIIGNWFAKGNNRRERVVMATKVYHDTQEAIDGPNGGVGLSAFRIRRHIEGSLKRLQTDHIELYQMHHIERHATWDELWGVFESLVDQGNVYYVGSSNFPAWYLMQAQQAAKERHFLGLVSEQHRFSLTCRLPELEVLPATSVLGIGLIAYSPLGGGLLTGSVLNPAPGSRGERMAKMLSDAQRKQLEDYSALCREIGESESNVALAWLLHNPSITAPIIGPRTVEQLNDALHALEITLTDDVLARLDEIFPGPGGAAPEAYAW